MAKIDSKEILRRIKGKSKPNKGNFTFRFDKVVMVKFRAKCEKQEVTPTAVLEEFMHVFSEEIKE